MKKDGNSNASCWEPWVGWVASPSFNATVEGRGWASGRASGLREVQGEGLDHPGNDTIFRRRIGMQSLFETAEECKQLTDNDIDDGEIFVCELAQPLTLEHHVVLPDKFAGDPFTNHELLEAEFFLIQFAKQVGFIRLQRGIGRQKAYDERVFMDVAHRAVAEPQIGLTHGAHPAPRH